MRKKGVAMLTLTLMQTYFRILTSSFFSHQQPRSNIAHRTSFLYHHHLIEYTVIESSSNIIELVYIRIYICWAGGRCCRQQLQNSEKFLQGRIAASCLLTHTSEQSGHIFFRLLVHEKNDEIAVPSYFAANYFRPS